MNYLNFDKMNEIVEDALCKVNISNECPICKTLLSLDIFNTSYFGMSCIKDCFSDIYVQRLNIGIGWGLIRLRFRLDGNVYINSDYLNCQSYVSIDESYENESSTILLDDFYDLTSAKGRKCANSAYKLRLFK